MLALGRLDAVAREGDDSTSRSPIRFVAAARALRTLATVGRLDFIRLAA